MNAHDILSYGQRDVLAEFADLPSTQWGILVNTRWTVKDVLAHLLSFEVMLEEVLTSVDIPDADHPTLDDRNRDRAGFNDRQVDTRKSQTPDDLLRDMKATHQRVLALVDLLGPEKIREVGTIPWYGPEYSLDDYIVYSNYAHIREHVGQVKLALQRASEKIK